MILSLQNTLVEAAQAHTRLAVLRQSFVMRGSVARRSGSHRAYGLKLFLVGGTFGGPLGFEPSTRMPAACLSRPSTLALDTSFNSCVAKQEGSP